MTRHHSKTTILRQLEACPVIPEYVIVDLDRGDSAWHPGKTSGRPLRGRSRLVYIRYADGGIDCNEHAPGDDVAYVERIGRPKPVSGEILTRTSAELPLKERAKLEAQR